MKILITGGAGFIGSNLTKRLLKDGHNVSLVDNFITGRQENLSEINNMNCTLHTLDLSSPECIPKMDEILEDIDVVYHLAASVGVNLINTNPNCVIDNSLSINNNLFPLFEKHNVKVIYASSSEVYGETELITGSLEDDKLEINSPYVKRGAYACEKLMSEFILRNYSFPSVIVRFFNVVGEGQLPDYGHVLPTFIQKIQNGEEITIFDNGGQIRSFCDIRDAVEMLTILLDKEHDNEIYNIGNDNTENIVNINTLYKLCFDVCDKTTNIKNEEITPERGEIHFRLPNMSKMKKFYTPKYSLEDTIRSII